MQGEESKMNDTSIKDFENKLQEIITLPPLTYSAEILNRIKQLCKAEFTIFNLWWVIDGAKGDLKDLYDNQEYEIFIKPKRK